MTFKPGPPRSRLLASLPGTGGGGIQLGRQIGAPQGGDGADALTVRDVLALPALRDAEVAAGHAGLDRVVTGVNIIEVPDVWQWLEGGEFLLSAAYAWRDTPDELVHLLIKLDQSGISGVGFKLGHYLKALTEDLLATADALALPVVVLPPTVAYRDVFEPLYARLVARPPAAPPGALTKVHQALLRLGLDDQSIEKIAGALARQVRRPVRVVDLLDEVLYAASPGGVTLRTPFEELGHGDRALVETVSRHGPRRSLTTTDTTWGRALVAALVVGLHRHGSVLVLGEEPGEDAPALKQAAELISFLLLKRLAFLEGRRQASSLFFESLTRTAMSNEEAVEHALTMGIRLTRSCAVVVVGLVGQPQPPERWEALRRQVHRGLEPLPHLAAVESGDDPHLLVLVQLDDTAAEEVLGRLAERLRALGGSGGDGVRAVVAAGTPGAGLEGVRRSRSEAFIAYETALQMGSCGLVRFDDLGVERLLAQIPPGPIVRDYIDATLGALEHEPALRATLEAYLQTGCNKVLTAANLHLHRSSLIYRLDKIARLLDRDIDDPEHSRELWLALRMRRILRRAW